MEKMVNVAIVFAVVLGVFHFLSDRLETKKNKEAIMSFGSGVLLAYLILDLFPRIYLGVPLLNNALFLFVLIGFSLFHLVEKYIYQHASKEKLLKELREAHSIAFFIYYVIIGIILKSITESSTLDGFLFFLPLVFHTTLGSVSIKEIHKSIRQNNLFKVILSTSPLLGVLLSFILDVPPGVYFALLGFIGGALLFIIIREVIPEEKKGDPLNFLIGMVSYSILIVSTWVV